MPGPLTQQQFVTDFFDNVLEWIQINRAPDEVFSFEELKQWATSFEPEDIFPQKVLDEWAYDQGFRV